MKKLALSLSLLVAACSTPAPDASGMKQGPQLTMPPSYDLRPPKAEAKPMVVAEAKMVEKKEEPKMEQKEEKSFWDKLTFWN